MIDLSIMLFIVSAFYCGFKKGLTKKILEICSKIIVILFSVKYALFFVEYVKGQINVNSLFEKVVIFEWLKGFDSVMYDKVVDGITAFVLFLVVMLVIGLVMKFVLTVANAILKGVHNNVINKLLGGILYGIVSIGIVGVAGYFLEFLGFKGYRETSLILNYIAYFSSCINL